MEPSYQTLFSLAAVLVPLFCVFLAIGMHLAVVKAFGLLDGHLERFQGKLDVMLAAQVEHNQKIDAILRKLY